MEDQLLPPSQEERRQLEISLYRELLDCLEQEAQALAKTQEETILTLANNKEAILRKLLQLKADQPEELQPPAEAAGAEELSQLKLRVASANDRNRRIIAASLEVIQEFLGQFQPPGPGIYRAEGQMQPGSGMTLFHRRA